MFKKEVHSEILENQQRMLQAALTVDQEMNKRLRELIAEELKEARGRVVRGIKFKNGDPRETARSVHRTVYKRLLGGNINILDSKRGQARHTGTYEPPRKVYPGMKGYRGGNRTIRSQRTHDIMTLDPRDRGFVLRMVNSGTNPRYSGGGRVELRGSSMTNFFKMQKEGIGYRGSIAPRNFFGTTGQREMQVALNNLAEMIEKEYNKLFKD